MRARRRSSDAFLRSPAPPGLLEAVLWCARSGTCSCPRRMCRVCTARCPHLCGSGTASCACMVTDPTLVCVGADASVGVALCCAFYRLI